MKFILIYKFYGGITEFKVYDNDEALEAEWERIGKYYCTNRFRYVFDENNRNWFESIRNIIKKYMELECSSVKLYAQDYGDTWATGVFKIYDRFSVTGSILKPNIEFDNTIRIIMGKIGVSVTNDINEDHVDSVNTYKFEINNSKS